MEDFIRNLTNLRNLTPVVRSNSGNKQAVESFKSASGVFNRATRDYRPEDSVGLSFNYKDNKNNLRAGLLIVDRESANKWANGEAESLDIYGAELDDGSSLDFGSIRDIMKRYDKRYGEKRSWFTIPNQESFKEGNYIDMDEYDAVRNYRGFMSDNFPSRINRVGRTKEPLPQLQPTFYSRLRDTYKK